MKRLKKKYEKPLIEIELYYTDSNIAECTTKVSWGPDADMNAKYGYANSVCSEYEDAFAVSAADSSGYYQNWYADGSCSCYLSSGNTLVSS